VSPVPRQPSRAERAERGADNRAGRVVSRRPRPAPPHRPRPKVEIEHGTTPGEVAALRTQVLGFVLTLPEVALGDSRLDADAAGIFVRVSGDDGTPPETREFATLRNHPRWRLSVRVPIGAMVDLQRLGWGRPRPSDEAGPLLLELAGVRNEADVAALQGILAAAHRAAANPQAPS